MSSKLIIQKCENGETSKSMCMYIENEHCEFGKWTNEKIFLKNKNIEQSQLIVKKLNEDFKCYIDIESCAREIDATLNARVWELDTKTSTGNCDLHTLQKEDGNILEYSLERVKKNNAKIMESIHKLNKTLNYSKKKGFFDINSTSPLRSYPCDICGAAFVYETGLRRHYTIRHGNFEKQLTWQIVWTCTNCFQVWPRKEFALRHSASCSNFENTEHVREIKTSLLLQCEFCEKVFTNIPKLVKHSQSHSTDKNYECNACKINFDSYKLAEQHWIVCPWLSIYYKFSLPKMLLCNVCDHKFRNYDHLFNHRYKAGHLILKIGHENNSSSILNMQYQCELCGTCFQNSVNLISHRTQCLQHINAFGNYKKEEKQNNNINS